MTGEQRETGRTTVEEFYEDFSLDAGLRDWLRPNSRHERLRLELDDALGGARDLDILDLGCGGGVLSSFLCRYGAVTGIDLSSSATELASLLEPRASFEAGTLDAHEPRRPYDLITLFDVLEHVPTQDRGALFEELDRVRAPGGWIMLSTPHPDFARWVSENRPELMQVVDEPVELTELVQLAAGIDLEPVAYRAYSVDAPAPRQYQFVVLAPMAGRARELYRPLRGHWLRARLASASNPVAPAARRMWQALRLLRAGRPRGAAWLLHLRRKSPL